MLEEDKNSRGNNDSNNRPERGGWLFTFAGFIARAQGPRFERISSFGRYADDDWGGRVPFSEILKFYYNVMVATSSLAVRSRE